MFDPGIRPEAFAARYLETQPWLCRSALRGAGAAAADALRWPEIDELLHHLEPSEDGLQLHRQGLIPQDSYTAHTVIAGSRRRQLVAPRFYGELLKGATLVLNRVEMHWLRAQRLCAQVGAFTGLPATGNAYLSFARDAGAESANPGGSFGAHWDTHDVFALQLLGRKRWQVFAPTFPLPLSQHRSQQSAQRPAPPPALDVVLETGDLLYLPRGWWHQVLALDQASVHLSVGTYGATVHDYLMWLASRVLPTMPAARRGLGQALPAELAPILSGLSAAARDPSQLAAFRRVLEERAWRGAGPFDLGALAGPVSAPTSGAPE